MRDYNRLTKRDLVGTCINMYEFANEVKKWQEQHGLYDYMGADTTQILLERLAELEDKIENGTLVELPCKVGDVLYYVNKYGTTPRIEENKVHTIEIYECMDGLTIRIWTQNGTFYADKMPNVFPTKAEAEAKLRELKGERE